MRPTELESVYWIQLATDNPVAYSFEHSTGTPVSIKSRNFFSRCQMSGNQFPSWGPLTTKTDNLSLNYMLWMYVWNKCIRNFILSVPRYGARTHEQPCCYIQRHIIYFRFANMFASLTVIIKPSVWTPSSKEWEIGTFLYILLEHHHDLQFWYRLSQSRAFNTQTQFCVEMRRHSVTVFHI